MVGVIGIDGDFVFNELLDIDEEFVLFGRAVGNGISICAGPPGPANAVDIGFGFIGKIEIDDKRDIFDVDSPGCDIRRNENGEIAFFEPVESAFPLRLGTVPVNGFGGEAFLFDPAAKLVGSVFRSGKDDCEFAVPLLTQVLCQKAPFVIAGDKADLLGHFLRGGDFRRDGY